MKITFHITLLLLLLFSTAAPAGAQQNIHRARARQAAEALQQWYNTETGVWETTSWWNAANALTTIIHYTKWSGDPRYLNVISNTFDRCREFEVKYKDPSQNWTCRNFINAWYDDEGWWVLVWIDAYDLTKDNRYLEMAKTTFADMTHGWDDVCGGGVYWKKPDIGKHAITNELFMLSAIRLHQRLPDGSRVVGGRTCLRWAKDTWRWMRDSAMVNKNHLVENGFSDDCQLQRGTYYTYNQGIILSALTELGQVTGDRSLLELAKDIAGAAIHNLVDADGILRDPKEPQVTGDSAQFKGVFLRHLTRLYLLTGDQQFKTFILKNADSLWRRARNPVNNRIGALWAGPFDKGDAARQSSALDALNAAMAVTSNPPVILRKGSSAPAHKP